MHERLEKGIRVLDVGCGPGWWTLVRKKKRQNITIFNIPDKKINPESLLLHFYNMNSFSCIPFFLGHGCFIPKFSICWY